MSFEKIKESIEALGSAQTQFLKLSYAFYNNLINHLHKESADVSTLITYEAKTNKKTNVTESCVYLENATAVVDLNLIVNSFDHKIKLALTHTGAEKVSLLVITPFDQKDFPYTIEAESQIASMNFRGVSDFIKESISSFYLNQIQDYKISSY
jgi:hypothetical protein